MGERLIEAGFPCHKVGAETQREQSVGLQPPVNRLHVWWARRPLTPSRAAIVASLDPAGTDPDTFIRQLGIERVQALVHGATWTITDKLLERIEYRQGAEVLPVDAVVLRALDREQARRDENQALIAELRGNNADLVADPVLERWSQENKPLPMPWPDEGDELPVIRVPADPAWANERIAFEDANKIRTPEDKYLYPRAYSHIVPWKRSGLTVLDPTSGGGSIPFEALRVGHSVVANELNPVAAVILYATLDYPARFGGSLERHIEEWGNKLLADMRSEIGPLFPASKIPEPHYTKIEKLNLTDPDERQHLSYETLDGFLYPGSVA